MTYVIDAPKRPSVTVAGAQGRFPVRRIYCIGRNYADHAIEMGHDPDKEPPFFFQKNADAVNQTGQFPYPAKSSDVHFEVEMVVALKSGGQNIATADALTHVFGYGIGLDMTRRDLQAHMKKMGRPWEIAKSFEQSAPMGPIVPVDSCGHLSAGAIDLAVNGTLRQQGDLTQMIWKVPEMISHLSEYYKLAGGDLILTGTPAGVGPIEPGDILTAKIDGLGTLDVTVI